jgi:hypothetical protein
MPFERHPQVKQYRENAPKPPPAKTEAVSVFTEIKQDEKFVGNAKKGGLPSLQGFRSTASVDVVVRASVFQFFPFFFFASAYLPIQLSVHGGRCGGARVCGHFFFLSLFFASVYLLLGRCGGARVLWSCFSSFVSHSYICCSVDVVVRASVVIVFPFFRFASVYLLLGRCGGARVCGHCFSFLFRIRISVDPAGGLIFQGDISQQLVLSDPSSF